MNTPALTPEEAMREACRCGFSVIQFSHTVEVRIGDELIHRAVSAGDLSRLDLTCKAIAAARSALRSDT